MKRDVRRGEAGASLVLVLVALVVFGLLVPVLGQFGSVNGVSAYIVKGQRYDRYAADSGMQAAIAWAQKNRTAGRNNLACPRLSFPSFGSQSPAFQRTVHVDCQGFHDSGVPQETPVMPAYAVQALGDGKKPGIDILGNGTLTTGGAWWSNSWTPKAIDVDTNSVIDATADVVGGKGSCANIIAAPNRCGTDTVPDPLVAGLDPTHWSSAVNSIRDVPLQDVFRAADGSVQCPPISPSRVLALQPGFYWDVDGLNKVGSGDCGPVVIWFQPGKYYFDFDFFDDTHTDDAARWTIGGGSSQVVVVGGTRTWPTGGAEVIAAANAVAHAGSTTSGACASGAAGVELNFGSSSHVLLEPPALMELCPLIANDHQQFSIYNTVNGATPVQPAPTLSTTPTGATADGHGDPFTWPDTPPTVAAGPLANLDCPTPAARCTDTGPNPEFWSGTLTDANGSRGATGTITMTIPDPVPAGTRLEQFDLSITHRETEGRNNDLDQLRVWVEGLPPGVTCDGIGTAARPAPVRPSVDEWTTTASQLTCRIDPGGRRAYRPSANLRVKYEVVTRGHRGGDGNPDPSVTVDVDQVKLIGHFTPPVVRAVDRCVADATCKLLEIDNRPGSRDARAFIWGTVYTPQGSVRLNAGGHSDFGFERGVVARSVSVDSLPTADPKFVPFALPGGGSYTDRLVTFEAFLNADTSPILSARVRFCDLEPGLGAAVDGCTQGGGPPRVKAWTPKR